MICKFNGLISHVILPYSTNKQGGKGMKDKVLGLFVEAMESNLTDDEKLDIINGLYEVMDIFNSALGD